jgi:hypothetical protein
LRELRAVVDGSIVAEEPVAMHLHRLVDVRHSEARDERAHSDSSWGERITDEDDICLRSNRRDVAWSNEAARGIVAPMPIGLV